MPPKTLNFHAGPMVWIDCEMTGLEPRKDKIIEIAVRFLFCLLVVLLTKCQHRC